MSGGSRMQFGPWVVLRRLGEGGFGVVYECQHIEDRRFHAAIKVLMRGTQQPRMRIRFEREHGALLRMTEEGIHNIPQVREPLGDPKGDHPFYAMDFVHGTNFEDLLYDGIEPSEILRHLAVVSRTMSRAHALQLYHRDLKPSNLLLDRVRNEPVIVDFGSVRMGDESKFTIAGRGDLGITPKYAPPEALETANPDAAAGAWDVYAMGVLLHDFVSMEPMEVPEQVLSSKGALVDYWLQKKQHGPLTLPAGAAERWPSIDALMRRMTSPEVDQRPTMLEVAEALDEASARGPAVVGLGRVTVPLGDDGTPNTASATMAFDEELGYSVKPAATPEPMSVRPVTAPRAVATAALAPAPEAYEGPSQRWILGAALLLGMLAVGTMLAALWLPEADVPQAPVEQSVQVETVSTPTPGPTPLVPEPTPTLVETVVSPTPAAVATPVAVARPVVVATPSPAATPAPTPAAIPSPIPPTVDGLRAQLENLYDEGPDAAAAALADPVRLDSMLKALGEGGRSADPDLRQMAASVSGTLWGQVRRLGPGSKDQLAQTLASGRRLDKFAALPEAVEAGGAVGLAPFLVDAVADRAPKSPADISRCRSFRRLLRQVSGELDGDQPWLTTACDVCEAGGQPLTGYCRVAEP